MAGEEGRKLESSEPAAMIEPEWQERIGGHPFLNRRAIQEWGTQDL
jgi:hypothetical protein